VTSLNGGQPNFARSLVSSWAGTLYIYIFGYCMALQQRASAKLCGVVQGMELRNFRRGRHLYSSGWLSCWASAHIPFTQIHIVLLLQQASNIYTHRWSYWQTFYTILLLFPSSCFKSPPITHYSGKFTQHWLTNDYGFALPLTDAASTAWRYRHHVAIASKKTPLPVPCQLNT